MTKNVCNTERKGKSSQTSVWKVDLWQPMTLKATGATNCTTNPTKPHATNL